VTSNKKHHFTADLPEAAATLQAGVAGSAEKGFETLDFIFLKTLTFSLFCFLPACNPSAEG
jgi:hypothetical protein